MHTMTIRGIDEEAFEQLKKQSQNAHCSLNKYIVRTLRTVAFPGRSGQAREWHDLDGFFKSWSPKEARDVMARCAHSRKIDAELWK